MRQGHSFKSFGLVGTLHPSQMVPDMYSDENQVLCYFEFLKNICCVIFALSSVP